MEYVKKKCIKCGKEIVNGENGCMLMEECFDCHGGYPKYPKPRQDNGYTFKELNFSQQPRPCGSCPMDGA